jgi:hypothetical protein
MESSPFPWLLDFKYVHISSSQVWDKAYVSGLPVELHLGYIRTGASECFWKCFKKSALRFLCNRLPKKLNKIMMLFYTNYQELMK